MKFCSIASGSSGNCLMAGSSSTTVLIDAGISGKRIESGLNNTGQTLGDVDALLITHEHSDHIRALGVLMRKYGMPVYATAATIDAMKKMTNLGKLPEDLFHPVKAGQSFDIGDLSVTPFSLSHDAADPVGYRVSHNGKTFAAATDTGCYDSDLVDNLRDLDVLLLEANHDIRMLEAGPYPYYLKMRILGDRGHLSNESAGKLLSEVLHDRMKRIYLGHLSKENNFEQLAFETVCDEVTSSETPYRSCDFNISIASRDVPGEAVVF